MFGYQGEEDCANEPATVFTYASYSTFQGIRLWINGAGLPRDHHNSAAWIQMMDF